MSSKKRYRLAPGVVGEAGKKRTYSEARAMVPLLVWYEDHLSLTDLGIRLGCDLYSLCQAVNRLRKRADRNPRLAGELQRLNPIVALILHSISVWAFYISIKVESEPLLRTSPNVNSRDLR